MPLIVPRLVRHACIFSPFTRIFLCKIRCVKHPFFHMYKDSFFTCKSRVTRVPRSFFLYFWRIILCLVLCLVTRACYVQIMCRLCALKARVRTLLKLWMRVILGSLQDHFRCVRRAFLGAFKMNYTHVTRANCVSFYPYAIPHFDASRSFLMGVYWSYF